MGGTLLISGTAPAGCQSRTLSATAAATSLYPDFPEVCLALPRSQRGQRPLDNLRDILGPEVATHQEAAHQHRADEESQEGRGVGARWQRPVVRWAAARYAAEEGSSSASAN